MELSDESIRFWIDAKLADVVHLIHIHCVLVIVDVRLQHRIHLPERKTASPFYA